MARYALEIADRTLGPISYATKSAAAAVYNILGGKGGCKDEMAALDERHGPL